MTQRRVPLRAAVIGAGFVGAQHAAALGRIGVGISVVAASDPRRAELAAAALGAEWSTGDWLAAATDPSVDVVHVCVPNDLHRPVVIAALEAGKHVICEKPLALDAVEGAELVAAAGKTDRVTALCHNYRFFPMAAELRLRVSDGVLGTPHAVRGVYLQDWLLSPNATNWRVDARRGGRSRVMADIGSHWIDLAETVTGQQLKSVLGQVATIHSRRPGYHNVDTFSAATDGSSGHVEVDTEDQASLLLRFGGGLQGNVFLSQVAAGHHNQLEISIDGATGSATWRQEHPDELWVATADGTEIAVRGPGALRRGAGSLSRLPAGHTEGWADALRNLLAAAYQEMAGGRSALDIEAAPLATFADGMRHLGFVEAALRSAAEGRWVAISEVIGSSPALEVS